MSTIKVDKEHENYELNSFLNFFLRYTKQILFDSQNKQETRADYLIGSDRWLKNIQILNQ